MSDMSVVKFTQFGGHGRVLFIDMTRVEALLEHERGGTVIVTGTDTYHVEFHVNVVNDMWYDAINATIKKRSAKNAKSV